MFNLSTLLSPLATSAWPEFSNVTVIRGDLLHPVVSGNKLYKLLPVVKKSLSINCSALISVGGRFSNHLHALAWVGNQLGLPTVGIVLGYKNQDETPTIADCKKWGMEIHFVDRTTFQRRYSDDFWASWLNKYPNAYRINEGGWSSESIEGSGLWWSGISKEVDLVVTPVGSGSTLAGLISSPDRTASVIGIPVFRDPNGYQDLVEKLVIHGLERSDIELWGNYSGKGFGKREPEVESFAEGFLHSTGIELDPVYTAKAFFALADKLKQSPELRKKKIAILHTGGLQGARV